MVATNNRWSACFGPAGIDRSDRCGDRRRYQLCRSDLLRGLLYQLTGAEQIAAIPLQVAMMGCSGALGCDADRLVEGPYRNGGLGWHEG
jgi:hypothetical protein